jgi:hypothetical protein
VIGDNSFTNSIESDKKKRRRAFLLPFWQDFAAMVTKMIISYLAAAVSCISAFLWFWSAQVKFSEQTGTLSDLDPAIARQNANAVHAHCLQQVGCGFDGDCSDPPRYHHGAIA